MIPAINKFIFRRFKAYETKVHELNYLFWECTRRCNLGCLHCGSDCSNDSMYPDMPAEDFLRAIDTIKQPSPGFTVVMTGGEPLLRNDLELCGREIRKRKMRWSLVTNGHLYSRERHDALLSAGMGALTISLDGLEESHGWLRKTSGSFDKVISAVSIASGSSRLNFDVVTCVNRRNIGELSRIRDLLVSLNVRAWRLFTIIPVGRAAGNPELMLSDAEFIQLMDFIAHSRKKKGINVSFSCEGYVGIYEWKVRDSGFFCRAGINIGSVLADGSVSACPNIDRSFVQGNIYENDLFDTWQTGFQPFRNREWTRKGQCSSCRSYKDCRGNGFHNWHGDKTNVLVCHNGKIEQNCAHLNVNGKPA